MTDIGVLYLFIGVIVVAYGVIILGGKK
jgi:hypothetical protein